MRGPGFWNTDLALSKNLALTERVRFQLRADLFNAFNHTNFNAVSTTINNANFGRFTSTMARLSSAPRITMMALTWKNTSALMMRVRPA